MTIEKAIEQLGELIKVFKGICPYCQCIVTNEYCSRCGHAMDWSDENE